MTQAYECIRKMTCPFHLMGKYIFGLGSSCFLFIIWSVIGNEFLYVYSEIVTTVFMENVLKYIFYVYLKSKVASWTEDGEIYGTITHTCKNTNLCRGYVHKYLRHETSCKVNIDILIEFEQYWPKDFKIDVSMVISCIINPETYSFVRSQVKFTW